MKRMASIRERNGKFAVIYNYKDSEGKKRQKWEHLQSQSAKLSKIS